MPAHSGLRLSALALLGAAGALAACGDGALEVCNSIAFPSVSVQVRDSASGAFKASGATLVLTDGAFVDSMVVPGSRPDLDALHIGTLMSTERAGTYSVTVRRAGYADWVRTGVVVRQGRCNVQTVRLTARLRVAP